MANLKKIVQFLDDYLGVKEIKDASWNGLQVEGKPEVRKILCAVDAGRATFERAVDEKAGLVVVHHGHYWKSGSPLLTGWMKRRLDVLLKNGVSLYACHLPLDMHKTVGNNAQLMNLLGARITGKFFLYDGAPISWAGRFKKPVTMAEMERKLTRGLNTKCTALPFGPARIKTVGVCSGGGGYGASQAAEKGLDLYVSGEPVEIYHMARDAKLNVIFAGHHATETLGVKALAKVLARKFKIPAVFVDLPTGL